KLVGDTAGGVAAQGFAAWVIWRLRFAMLTVALRASEGFAATVTAMLALPVPPDTIVTHGGTPLTVHAHPGYCVVNDVYPVSAPAPKPKLVVDSCALAHAFPAWLSTNALSAITRVSPRADVAGFSAAE